MLQMLITIFETIKNFSTNDRISVKIDKFNSNNLTKRLVLNLSYIFL